MLRQLRHLDRHKARHRSCSGWNRPSHSWLFYDNFCRTTTNELLTARASSHGGAWAAAFSSGNNFGYSSDGAGYAKPHRTTADCGNVIAATNTGIPADVSIYLRYKHLAPVATPLQYIIFNWSNTTNYWYWGFEFNLLKIYRVSAGVPTQQGSTVVPGIISGNVIDMRVSTKGDNIKCFINNRLVQEATVAGRALKTANIHGLSGAHNTGQNPFVSFFGIRAN